MVRPELLGLALLTGCLVPRAETHRPALTVSVSTPGATTLAVCTWSSWNRPEHGCADMRRVPIPDGAVSLPAFTTGPPTLIFGEAPLMETLLVACAADGGVLGLTGLPMAFHGTMARLEPGPMRVEAGEGMRTVSSADGWTDLARAMCDESAMVLEGS